MANNNETTTKFKVDISELKKAMQEAKRQVAVTNSEFKAISSSMDDWTKSTEGISAKLNQLGSNLKSQKTILKSLEDQYELTVKEMGEGSKAADDLRIKINNQKATINQTEREIGQYKEALDEVAEAEKKAAKTGKSVAEVLDETADKAKDAGDGFTVFKGAVATFAGNVLTGLANGLKEAATNLLGLGEATREYRDQMSKLETASVDAGYSVDYAKNKYKELYGVLADETAANTTVSNFMAMGAEEETLNSLLNSSIGIWAKYGDSIPLDGLAESINETSRVSKVTGNLADALVWAGINEDEFNEKLADCTTEQERQRLIADTLNSVYGDLSNSYQESNKSVIDANKAQADYTDTMAELGEKVEPVTTELKEGVNGLLQELLKLVQDVDIEAFTSKIEEGFKVIKDDVIPAVKEGFGWILDNKDTLIAGLAGIAAGFAAFKVASLITAVTTALQGMSVATALAAAKTWLLNTALLANPIALVAALIVGLVTAFVVLWNKSEAFRNFWIGLWDNIKSLCGNAVDAIGVFFTETIPEFIDNMIEFLSELPTKVWEWLLSTINKVGAWADDMTTKAKNTAKNFVEKIINFVSQLPSKVWTWLSNTISKVTTWSGNMATKAKEAASNFVNKVIEYVQNLPSKVGTWLSNTISKVVAWKDDLIAKGKSAASGLVESVVDTVSSLPSKMASIGSDLVTGLWNGINDVGGWLKNKISGFVGDVTSWLKNFFGIASPSKVMANEIGKWLPEGIAVGIDKNAKSAINSMKDLAVNTVGAATSGLSSATTATGGVIGAGVVNNYNQVINSPKPLTRLEIYRQSKNLLGFTGGGF